MKPQKSFFWFFWIFLFVISAMVLPANLKEKNIINLLIFFTISVFLLILSIALFKFFFSSDK